MEEPIRGRSSCSARSRQLSFAAGNAEPRWSDAREEAWPGKEWLLNRALRVDDDVAEALFSQNRLVPTYTKSQITPLKNNYNGATPDPSYIPEWHLQLRGLASGLSVSLNIRNLLTRFQMHDQIHVGQLMVAAQHQVYRESLAAELPTATLAATGVEAEEGTRLFAGALTASHLFEHAGAGVNFTQLIYDFGHTHNLILSHKLEEEASNANALATTEEVVLATDEAFYNALLAQAEVDVARQTVAARQITDEQVRVMARNRLKPSRWAGHSHGWQSGHVANRAIHRERSLTS